MPKKLYHHTKIKSWYVYEIEEICSIFKPTGLHPQTIRNWIKNGLNKIDNQKPILIYGADLIAFLKKQNQRNKCQTPFEEMYCMKCQDARPVLQNKVIAEQKRGFLHLKGQCRECKSVMNKSYKLDDLSRIRKIFLLGDVSELKDCQNPTAKTQINNSINNTPKESLDLSLFDGLGGVQ